MAKKTRQRKNARSTKTPSKSSGKGKGKGKSAWKLMDRGTTLIAGFAALKVSALVWRVTTGKKPPTSTRHPELRAREAVTWAVFGGVGSELAKVLLRRQAASYWVKSTGRLPPGMKPLKDARNTGAETDVVEADVVEAAARRAAKGRRPKKDPK